MNTLYNKDQYLNHDVPYLTNEVIYEYDIKSAGLNLTKYYNLLDKDLIDELSSIKFKDKLVKRLGVIQRDNKEFKQSLKQAFKDIRELFFSSNNLEESHIHSIKKDAIFTYKPCKYVEFENVKFVNKNIYTSYYLFDKYEFYYNTKKIDVKGIDDKKLLLHKEYMMEFLDDTFNLMELKNRKECCSYLRDFVSYYKKRELQSNYYRELNRDSNFIVGNEKMQIKDEDDLVYFDKEMININYNIENYILPIINIVM